MLTVVLVSTPISRLNDRWHVNQSKPRQGPLDALNDWKGRAKAEVDWDESCSRSPDNTVTHTVIPLVSCDQHHVVGHDMIPHVRRVCDNPEDSFRVVEKALLDWLCRKGEELIEFECNDGYDDQGRYIVWVTRYISRLVHLPIQQCTGQGRSLVEAKRQAAQMLLQSRHCMVCLPR